MGAERSRVVVAGGGVAGLEALLALRALAPGLLEPLLLSPAGVFTFRPLLVTAPFGSGGETGIDLGPIVRAAGARQVRDALAAVDPDAQALLTTAGARLEYDFLLVAPGARPVEAVPGALTFGVAPEGAIGDLLHRLGRRGTRRLAFAVAAGATWSMAAYELALLTAAERDARRISGVEITVVTHEPSPLHVFGEAGSAAVGARLEQAGVRLRVSAAPQRFEAGRLSVAGGEPLEFDRVVALPALEVPAIAGLPQDERGFLATDPEMRVVGVEWIWAAGDAAGFPVKQGGLAAQQADVAASAIAARAGATVRVEPFRPVLRGTLITGAAPEYLGDDPSQAKLSADHLGPHLAAALGVSGTPVPEADRERAVRLLLATADADAESGDMEAALRWLSLVEQLNLVIPASYVARRDEWRRRLDASLERHPAARRIDPQFDTVADAIIDLRRRLGWLRAAQARGEDEMGRDLAHLDAAIEDVVKLSRGGG